METLKKAEFLVCAETSGEKYQGENKVCCTLLIDYYKKSYEIIPPPMNIETDCKLPLWVSDAIKLAYEKAIYELKK